MNFVLVSVLGVVLLTVAQSALIRENVERRGRPFMPYNPDESDSDITDETNEFDEESDFDEIREMLDEMPLITAIISVFCPRSPQPRMLGTLESKLTDLWERINFYLPKIPKKDIKHRNEYQLRNFLRYRGNKTVNG